jgi:hypothetical protein
MLTFGVLVTANPESNIKFDLNIFILSRGEFLHSMHFNDPHGGEPIGDQEERDFTMALGAAVKIYQSIVSDWQKGDNTLFIFQKDSILEGTIIPVGTLSKVEMVRVINANGTAAYIAQPQTGAVVRDFSLLHFYNTAKDYSYLGSVISTAYFLLKKYTIGSELSLPFTAIAGLQVTSVFFNKQMQQWLAREIPLGGDAPHKDCAQIARLFDPECNPLTVAILICAMLTNADNPWVASIAALATVALTTLYGVLSSKSNESHLRGGASDVFLARAANRETRAATEEAAAAAEAAAQTLAAAMLPPAGPLPRFFPPTSARRPHGVPINFNANGCSRSPKP